MAESLAKPPAKPLVGVIMGSQSDWATMQHAAETLEALGVPFEARIVSAHRTPKRMATYAAKRAKARAEGDHRRRRRGRPPAGHDGGDDRRCRCWACRSKAPRSRARTVFFPSSRCRPAFRSAPWRSAAPARSMPPFWPRRSSALATPRSRRRWQRWRARQTAAVAEAPSDDAPPLGRSSLSMADRRSSRRDRPSASWAAGQLGRMTAMAAARLGYRCDHLLRPRTDSIAGQVAAGHVQGAYDDTAALARFAAAGRCHHLRVRERARGHRRGMREAQAGAARACGRSTSPSTGCARRSSSARLGIGTAAYQPIRSEADVAARDRAARHPQDLHRGL